MMVHWLAALCSVLRFRRGVVAGVLSGVAPALLVPTVATAESERASLRTEVGVGSALEDWTSVAPERGEFRLSSLTRLGSLGTRSAIQRLAELLTDPRLSSAERATATRALAPHASDAVARRALARELAEGISGERDEFAHESRVIAALGLARAGDAACLPILVGALGRDAATAAIASDALLTYPPRDLSPLLAAPPTPVLAELLGALGDQRAFPRLKAWVTQGSLEMQTSAARALLRLGALETVELARWWLDQGSPQYRVSAAEILSSARAVAPDHALQTLIDADELDAAIALAQSAPNPHILGPLSEVAARLPASARANVISAIAATETEAAVRWVASQLADPATQQAAAIALAQIPQALAEKTLEDFARTPGGAELGRRALVARYVKFDAPDRERRNSLQPPSSATTQPSAYLRSLIAAARPAEATRLLSSSDIEDLIAASHTAWLQPESFFVEAGQRLAEAQDTRARLALSVALLHPKGAEQLSTERLLTLHAETPLLRPLLRFTLASRGGAELESFLRSWLTDPDPVLRSATLAGLAPSEDPRAVSWLRLNLGQEHDSTCRVAAVVGLSGHRQAAALRVLREVAEYDPYPAVRFAARAALAGEGLAMTPASSRRTLWLDAPKALGAGKLPKDSRTVVQLRVAPGLTVPVMASASGAVTWLGAPEEVQLLNQGSWTEVTH